jgi:hypothetical protein
MKLLSQTSGWIVALMGLFFLFSRPLQSSSVIFIDLLSVEVSLQMQKSLMHLYAAVGLLIIGLGFIAGRSLNPNLSE